MAEYLDVSGVASLMERFLQNSGASSAHIDVGQICCVLDESLSSNVGERNVAVHTAIGQNSCKRDHESRILEADLFADVLFSDD